jgi:CheY-like chemotaxis protein/anti-sigma regulatory factor (Ser/Thr protein kinase)
MARILVVDDSSLQRKVAGALIERQAGMEVTYASGGDEALAAMAVRLPDLVLTDLVMPGVDGIELVTEVRRMHPQVPVVLMTAVGNEERAVAALNSGAASYIPKAVLERDLIKTLNSVLGVSHENRSKALLMQSMTHSESVFVLGNNPALIAPLVNYLQQSLAAMGLCNESETTRVGVALDEALVNAVHHGNLEVDSTMRRDDLDGYHRLISERRQQSPYRERKIQVSAVFDRDRATFVVRDEGSGFAPDKLPDPTDPANLARPHGRGVLLIRTFMDEVIYNEVGNEVTMTKLCTHRRNKP